MPSPPSIYGVNGLFGSRSIIVVFGDSLTQRGYDQDGWVSTLSRHYSRRADVINRGYGGFNTRWGKVAMYNLFKGPSFWDIFSKMVASDKDKYLTAVIWFGANDAAAENMNPHVPIIEYGSNLQDMIDHLKKFFVYIVVMTPPPVHGPTRLQFQRDQYGDKATGIEERNTITAGHYASMAKRIAEANNVLLLDIWTLMLSEGEEAWPRLVGAGVPGGDGLHLSPVGQQYVAKHLIDLLEVNTVRAEEIPQELPWGRDMSPTHFIATMNTYQTHTESRKIGQGKQFLLMSCPQYVSGAIHYTIGSLGAISFFLVVFSVARLVAGRNGYRQYGHSE